MLNIVIEKYFAEFATDRFIRQTFFPDFSAKGIMVEVGAATPEFLSMSEHFRINGWRCLCVEPNPTYVQMHRQRGREVYGVACGDEDRDDQDFEIVHLGENYAGNSVTDHSFSSLKVKEGYIQKHPEFSAQNIIKTKVNVRRLDTILDSQHIQKINFLSVDVEGWELDVMNGFSLSRFQPEVVLLENYLHDDGYVQYMRKLGYLLRYKVEYNYIFTPASPAEQA